MLSDQGASRRSAAEEAHEDFSGAYARLFTTVCTQESHERGRLVGVLDRLVAQVQEATALAQEERDRLKALADWQDRETQRDQDRAADPTSTTHIGSAVTDPKPSEVRVAPSTISAAFSGTLRTRVTSGGASGGKSSADPTKLRSFVTSSRAMNTSLEAEVVRLQNAWAAFTASCGWVPLGAVTFDTGFARMVTENQGDATWIETIAAAFDKAGGTGVLNTRLNTAAQSTILLVAGSDDFADLLDGNLSPADAAEYWASLGLTPADVKHLPPESLLQLASMPGLPAWAQDAAGREFINYALDHPGPAYDMMGFAEVVYVDPHTGMQPAVGVDGGITRKEFGTQIQVLKDELARVEVDATLLNGGDGDSVQLVDFGNHDGVVVAGISTGDLDTATNVGVNVSGMNSGVDDMENGGMAAHDLHNAAWLKDDSASYAVVNWVGYRSPGVTDVHNMDRADAGGERLLDFLNGVNASRQERGADPQQFNVFAHSYGSTTAAEALKNIDPGIINTFVTYGSAGLKNGTTLDEIQADNIYSTHAKGDNLAKIGQAGQKAVNPLDIGAEEFSSEASFSDTGEDLNRTTMHSMYAEEDKWTFSNMWAGTVGYFSPKSTSLDQMAHMLATGKARQ